MTSSDKDFRFMATNDLMTELQKDSIKVSRYKVKAYHTKENGVKCSLNSFFVKLIHIFIITA